MRKNKLVKTTKPNIYTITTRTERTEYIVRFSYLGKTYGERNFTKLFGCTTLKQTEEMFNSVKVQLSRGENPFAKKQHITLDTFWIERQKEIKEGMHKYILQKFYTKHIEPIIGNMDVDEIQEKHIYKILNGTLADSGSSNRMKLKVILNPILRKCFKKGHVTENVIEDIKFEKPTYKTELSAVLIDDYKTVSKQLYKQAVLLTENDTVEIEIKLGILLALMTARRRGEILKYKFDDIVDGKVFVPEAYTKTNKKDQFPLNFEMLTLLKKLPKRSNIFTIKEQRLTKEFNKLVANANIRVVKNQSFTLHNTRHLLQSIMIPEMRDSTLVDRCLTHAQNEMKHVYLSVEYKNRKEVFEKYWAIMRG